LLISSIALMPQSKQYFSTSSALLGSERKLYVMVPICTPPKTESGFAAISRDAAPAANASFPKSLLV
jgi:hypothetical protein